MNDTAAAFGSNNPPEDANPLLERLKEKYAPQQQRFLDLKLAYERFPEVIDSEDVCNKSVLFEKQLGALIVQIEEFHAAEKKPFLENGRTVDNFFLASMAKLLGPMKQAVNKRRVTYQAKVEEEKRKKAAEEAARAAEEAKARAESMQTEDDLSAAVQAEETAQVAQQQAASITPTEAGRVRTDEGVTASFSYDWSGEIVDKNKLDVVTLLPYLSADVLDKALKAYVRANKGAWGEDANPTFSGARIFKKPKSVVR